MKRIKSLSKGVIIGLSIALGGVSIGAVGFGIHQVGQSMRRSEEKASVAQDVKEIFEMQFPTGIEVSVKGNCIVVEHTWKGIGTQLLLDPYLANEFPSLVKGVGESAFLYTANYDMDLEYTIYDAPNLEKMITVKNGRIVYLTEGL